MFHLILLLLLLPLIQSQIFLTATWEEAQFDGENNAYFIQMKPDHQAQWLSTISPYFRNADNNTDILLGIDHMFRSDDGQIYLTLLSEYSNVGKVPARLSQDLFGVSVVHPNDDDEVIQEIGSFSKNHQFGMRIDGYDYVVEVGGENEKVISKLSDMFEYPSVDQIDYDIVDSDKGVRVWYLGNDSMLYYHGNNFQGSTAHVFRVYLGVQSDFANMTVQEWGWTGDLDEIEDTVSGFSEYNGTWYAGLIIGAFDGYKICEATFDWENQTIDFIEIARHEGNLTINGTIAPSYIGIRSMIVVQCLTGDDCPSVHSEENCGESFSCSNFNCVLDSEGDDCSIQGKSCIFNDEEYTCQTIDESTIDEETGVVSNAEIPESNTEIPENITENKCTSTLFLFTFAILSILI